MPEVYTHDSGFEAINHGGEARLLARLPVILYVDRDGGKVVASTPLPSTTARIRDQIKLITGN